MGAARILVTTELLRECLHLPVGTDIVLAVTVEWGHMIELTVTHPDLKCQAQPSELPPLLTPTFRRQEPVVFEGWNQA